MTNVLKPFFSYYGGKYKAALRYPSPTRRRLIEPFAGSAGYATRYPDRDVVLIDANPRIAALWAYLIRVSREEISTLPEQVDHVDDVRGPPEARDLVGFWLNAGTASPCKQPSSWMKQARNETVGFGYGNHWGSAVRDRIAWQVERIRHWRVVHGSFELAGGEPGTYFVDPPYSTPAGRYYATTFDRYADLAEWCRTRVGQVIVCEQLGATWLPFMPLSTFKSTHKANRPSRSSEVIWTNKL